MCGGSLGNHAVDRLHPLKRVYEDRVILSISFRIIQLNVWKVILMFWF